MSDRGGRWPRRVLSLLMATLVLAPLAWLNLSSIEPEPSRALREQLRFLEHAVDRNAAGQMQDVFPEGFVFMWALYGMSCAQSAQALAEESSGREHLFAQAERAIAEVHSARARSRFNASMQPAYGTFYQSWSLYVLARYVQTRGIDRVTPTLVARLAADADSFAAGLERSESPFTPSYPGQAWPADAAVGVGALGICSHLMGERYSIPIAHWVEKARLRLDPGLGVLSHEADPDRGTPEGGVRGSSLALMSLVLMDADSALALSQYRVFREQFVERKMGLVGAREYVRGHDGRGDIDSGPLLLGLSGPATVVGMAAARAHGDTALAGSLHATVELLGLPLTWRGERRYGGGLLPIGDAFIAWANSTTSGPARTSWGQTPSATWRWPLRVISLLIATLVVMRAMVVWQRR